MTMRTRGEWKRLAAVVVLLASALPLHATEAAAASEDLQTAQPLSTTRGGNGTATNDEPASAKPVEGGIISDDWVMSVVDANLSSLVWPGEESGYPTAPANPEAPVLVLEAQRFGYLNMRLKRKEKPVSGFTHVCLDVMVAENTDQPAPPQTILTLTGYNQRPQASASVSAHTVLDGNPEFAANAWSQVRIPLPDALDFSWYEVRIEEKSVQGSIVFVQKIEFCGGEEGLDSSGYSQCLWRTEGEIDVPAPASATMPFVEAVYLSGFGLAPRWTDRSYIGFYDFSYILPSGEAAVKALVGPNGALSFATDASFEFWEALHFQILASSNEVDVCLEVSRENESRKEAQCVESLWNQSQLTGTWVEVSAPLSDFGFPRPWNRFDLVDGSDQGIFFIVTNILFNSKPNSSDSGELWVLDLSEMSELEASLLDLDYSQGSGNSHVLGWSLGIVIGVVTALILVPILICIIFPKQPGKRLTSVPLCCVALHESFQEAIDDVSAYRHRFRIPATVKMKAANKKGWVESVTYREAADPDDGGGPLESTNIDNILPVYGVSKALSHSPSKASTRTASRQTLPCDTARVSPLPSERVEELMYHTHCGGSIVEEDVPQTVRMERQPLYKVSSISEGEPTSRGLFKHDTEIMPSPIVVPTNRSEPMSYRKFSNLQHVDDALQASCKALLKSSNDLKKLLDFSSPQGKARGKHLRKSASEVIDMSVASDYHELIEKQIQSLQTAQKLVAEEWRVMKEVVDSARSEQTPKRHAVEKIPSRTDVESMNVDIFKDVQITHLIGSGGSGSVYEGTYKGHRVAIKLLHNNNELNADQVDSLKTEVALLQNLRHPNIVNFLGCCLNPESLCVILEYAEGGSLHSMLHTNQKQPEYGTLLQLAEDVASAMDYCHSLEPPIIHRDLKPQNILLHRDGRAQVADFGIARIRTNTFVETKHLNAGTVAYMSPEIMQGRNVDEKCDVYSFGIILWECLTGQKPWADKLLPMQVVVAVGVEGDRLPLPSGCPISLKRLIRDCWRHDPRLRPTFREIKLRLAYLRNKHGSAH
ncbi:serine/threonine-protein kinase [Chloropicon primus]|uniref:Serine/threonine-protein kinase n=4 Tax=Chloropicon primus TaxID=1764295 RepID=A0A5B8MN79_9CHLO|nr:serine/threonine-protein kinase [Chloropicon primus]UPR01326.1 serine/threonine-protein kinase [Chloropicon primus]|eukprot:QDZ22108.1 serine/threonine-protein kinase [Chloropicon primus]